MTAVVLSLLSACERDSRTDTSAAPVLPALASSSASSPSPGGASSGPRFIAGAASGDLSDAVARAVSAASAEGRTLVVYVGATWCEPCQRFHHAVEADELTHVAPLARLTLLEFDLDRDRDRLAAAGYEAKYIPLFALPGQDGRSSGKQVEGGIKGDGAVAYMVPRLAGLLSQ